MAAENGAKNGTKVGSVYLGVELSTDKIAGQAAKLEEVVSKAAGSAGEKAGKELSDK